MNKVNAVIIIVFVGILAFLGGLFYAKWREGQKPKRVVIRQMSELPAYATVLKRVDPVYPPSALRDRIQGTVRLMVNVGKDGTTSSTTVVSGVRSDLDSAAIQALKSWVFVPNSSMAIVSVKFELEKLKKDAH